MISVFEYSLKNWICDNIIQYLFLNIQSYLKVYSITYPNHKTIKFMSFISRLSVIKCYHTP